jgi:agmatine deiminase
MNAAIKLWTFVGALALGWAAPLWSQEDRRTELNDDSGPDNWPMLRQQPPVLPGVPDPPAFQPRTAAEWEEIQALVIAWTTYNFDQIAHQNILTEIVRNAQQECRVIIHCDVPTYSEAYVRNYLTQRGVPMTNLEFFEIPSNTFWIRDYFSNSIYENSVDSLAFVDWYYNRPSRQLDNTLPVKLADSLGYITYEATHSPAKFLVHTGGNFMSDGMGTAFSSELVLDENADPALNPNVYNEQEIDALMESYMGIQRYIKMPTLPYDGIHHIDMHMKLLDEETLLVGQYPTGISDGPQIEANLQYVLSNYLTPFGTPYKVVRIPMPPDINGSWPSQGGDYRTYTNAVFVNKTILLPVYDERYDTTALRIWREALPGYRVVGIECDNMINLSGAIHCITHSLAAPDPLRIVHQPLTDRCADQPIQVSALVEHRSGIQSAEIRWTLDTAQGWNAVPMQLVGQDTFVGFIPPQADGAVVSYYVSATANNGKTMARPMPAPSGCWEFRSDCTVGLSVSVAPSIRLYPNPANGQLTLECQGEAASRANVWISDPLGRTLGHLYRGPIARNQRLRLDVSAFAPGIYFVTLATANGQTSVKIVLH